MLSSWASVLSLSAFSGRRLPGLRPGDLEAAYRPPCPLPPFILPFSGDFRGHQTQVWGSRVCHVRAPWSPRWVVPWRCSGHGNHHPNVFVLGVSPHHCLCPELTPQSSGVTVQGTFPWKHLTFCLTARCHLTPRAVTLVREESMRLRPWEPTAVPLSQPCAEHLFMLSLRPSLLWRRVWCPLPTF